MINNGYKNHSKYISQWDTEDVLKWLNEINMTSYSLSFESSKINGYDLCFLNNENLVYDFKINKFHDRNVILQSIKKYLLEQLIICVNYGEISFNIQLDLDNSYNIEKLSLMVKELFQFNDNKFFLKYPERQNFLSSSCKLVQNILLDPNQFKLIYVLRDTKSLQIINFSEKSTKNTNSEDSSNRDQKEKKSQNSNSHLDEKENNNQNFNKKEALALNISQVKQMTPILSKEKYTQKTIEEKTYRAEIEKISDSKGYNKNEMIERTNNYFNNLKSRVNLKSDFNKSFNDNKLNQSHSGHNNIAMNRYSSECKFSNQKENTKFYKTSNETNYKNNILNESTRLNGEKDKADFNINLQSIREKQNTLNKDNDSILNEKDIPEHSSRGFLKYSVLHLSSNNIDGI